MKINQRERLKDFLEEKFHEFHKMDFVKDDPISIPHQFHSKEDIEISAFLTSILSWGRRATIIQKANLLMEIMENSPYDFVMNFRDKDLKKASSFVHRTFNGDDLIAFMHALRHVYANLGGLEQAFYQEDQIAMDVRISNFKKHFFAVPHLSRTQKHISDPAKGSTAKRILMFLRWMVRKSVKGVDFGLWNKISASELLLPLDVHTARVSRKLKMLHRKQNDWKAVVEVSELLKSFDPEDPIKYDYALFGLGVNQQLESLIVID